MQNFYVDTCIYLNLWKKERGFIFEEPLWGIAKKFFDYVSRQNHIIYYSGFILKELLNKLSTEEYLKKREIFEEENIFKKVMLTKEEYHRAITIKNSIKTKCSLLDIIHVMLAKKTNSVLITQDKELLKLSNKNNVKAQTAQEAIDY
jgi:predicted nucleic acid-binding protein